MNLSRYAKSITALVGVGITWAGVSVVPDGHVDRFEWYALVVAFATTAGVYGIPNAPTPLTVAPVVIPEPRTP